MENVLVSIPGGNGRMGKTLIGLILEHSKLDLAQATCLPGEDEEGMDIGLLVGKGKISKELKSDTLNLFNDSNVLIDFTVPEAGSNGKALHIYVAEDVEDMSIYSFNTYSNGSDSPNSSGAYTMPAESASAGDHILIARSIEAVSYTHLRAHET